MNINNILLKLLKNKTLRKIIEKLRKIVLPFFDGIPLFDILVYFIKGIIKGDISTRAASLSYNFFMALFPLILFLFTIIAYLPIDNFIPMVYDFIAEIVPKQAYTTVSKTIDGILQKNSTLLSISILSSFFFATRGIRAMIKTFNNTYHSIETRNAITQITTSFWLLLILVLMIIVVISANIFFQYVISHIVTYSILIPPLLGFVKWILIASALFFSISTIYYFAPAKKSKYRFFSPGSSLATLLIGLSCAGFNIYISNFSRYNAIYGSIGTLIIILLWIHLIAMILIIGFELNASITHAKLHKQKIQLYR